MKNWLLFAFFCFFTEVGFAQIPQGIYYQSFVSDSAGRPLISKTIAVSISILQGNISGNVIYNELHILDTDNEGVFKLNIGQGFVTGDSLNKIFWPNGPYFIKSEVNTQGYHGTYNLFHVSQLLAVPYTFHSEYADSVVANMETDPIFSSTVSAKISAIDTATWNGKIESVVESDSIFIASVASSISSSDTINWNSKQSKIYAGRGLKKTNDTLEENIGEIFFEHYIGELFGGGIVFAVWKDSLGVEHGLISSLEDIDTAKWIIDSLADQRLGASSLFDGKANTLVILATLSHSAAKVCADYRGGGFNDWYLPALYELRLLIKNALQIEALVGENALDGTLYNNVYWSSTENWDYDDHATLVDRFNLRIDLTYKTSAHSIRAIRRF